MPDTMWGYWKATLGCNDLLNGTATFFPGVKDSVSEELVAIPRQGYTQMLRVDCSTPFGAKLETYSGKTPYPANPDNLGTLADFTYTNYPHNSSSQSLYGPTPILSKPIFHPGRNKFYYFYCSYVEHSYFVPIGNPPPLYNNTNYYGLCYVLEYDLTTKVITRKTVGGIGQLNLDGWLGEVTTGTTVTAPFFFSGGFTVYVGNYLYVSAYIKNNVHYMIKINLNTFVGTLININASGYVNSSDTWLAGVEDASGNGWCVQSGVSTVRSMARINGATDTLTLGNFGLGANYTWTDVLVDFQGNIWASPNNAPGILFINTSTSAASIKSYANYSTNGTTKSTCIMTNGYKIVVVPVGTTQFRTFVLIDVLTQIGTSYYTGHGFTNNPISSDAFGKGVFTIDQNFFCVPTSNNGDAFLFGGIRDQPPDPNPILFPGPPKRTGAVGNTGKVQGLRPPFMLYDFRNYDGGFLLRNEGTGGPMWDLTVMTYRETTNLMGISALWFWKDPVFISNHFDGSIIGAPYTFLMGINDGDYVTTLGATTNAYWETNAFGIGPTLSFQGAVEILLHPTDGKYVDDWDMDLSGDQFDSNTGLYTNNTNMNKATVRPDRIMGKGVLITSDNNNGGGSWYVGGVNQGNPQRDYVDPVYGKVFESDVYYTSIRTDYNANKLDTNINGQYRFFHYGFDAGNIRKDIPVAGQVPDCCIGFAVFRGEPSDQTEVDYWSNYFNYAHTSLPIEIPSYPAVTGTQIVDYLASLNFTGLWQFKQSDIADGVVGNLKPGSVSMQVNGPVLSSYTAGPDGQNYPLFGQASGTNYVTSSINYASVYNTGTTFLILVKNVPTIPTTYATIGSLMTKQTTALENDLQMVINGGSGLGGYSNTATNTAAHEAGSNSVVPANAWNLLEVYFPAQDQTPMYLWKNGLPVLAPDLFLNNYGIRADRGAGRLVVGADTYNNYHAMGYYALAGIYYGFMSDSQRGYYRMIAQQEGWF